LETAIQAGRHLGCGHVTELLLHAPLPIPGHDPVQIQVLVGEPGQDGHRPVEVYARPDDAQAPWTRHASGTLAPATADGGDPAGEFAAWPPEGAVPADTSRLYQDLAAAGYRYGPAFRGLRAAWRRHDDVFAEVALPEDTAVGAGSFGLHPALLEAAWHAAWL